MMATTLEALQQAMNIEVPFGAHVDGRAIGATRWDATRDPASGIPGMPMNLGRDMLPHVYTFQGLSSSQAKVYRPSDEAIKDSFDNARFMRNDPIVMECVEMRQRAVSLLDWSIEPEDEKDSEQKALADHLTKLLAKIPRFMQYRENLLHATWFGKYAVEQRWGWRNIAGKMVSLPVSWLPLHGDKIVFRYDDRSGDYRPDQIGIRIGAGYLSRAFGEEWINANARKIDATDYGLAWFLDTWERPMLALHKYRIEDGEYEEPTNAGRIHGVGIRSVIYWAWYQKQETLAFMMEYLERSAAGIEVWYYPLGNDQAETAMRKAAEERIGMGRNIIMVPKPGGDDADLYRVERIEPGMAGVEQLKSIVTEYFGHMIKRYILGQTLTTEASSTGLGSNLADIHMDTFMQIVRYDSNLLEEDITTDTLQPILRFNYPRYANIDFQFRLHTTEPDSQELLEALLMAWHMGLKLDAQQIRDLVGAAVPKEGDEILDRLQQLKEEQSLGGGPQAGAPGMEGSGGAPPLNTGGPPGVTGEDNIQDVRPTAPSEATGPAEYVANGHRSEKSDRERLLQADGPRAEPYQRRYGPRLRYGSQIPSRRLFMPTRREIRQLANPR